MTIDWSKLLTETNFDVLMEEDNLLLVKLKGGQLDNCNVNFSDIDLRFDESGKNMGVDFSYKVESTDENFDLKHSENLRSFLANIIFSHIIQEMNKEDQ